MDKRKPSDPSRLPPKLPTQKVAGDIDDADSQLHDEGWRAAPKEKTIEGEIKPIHIPKQVEDFSYKLFPLVGYGLLGFTFFAFIDTVIPIQFTDSYWEFRTQSRLVEMAPVSLMGLMFIFFRREGFIRRSELFILRCLSWTALVLGILYLLLIPLGLVNSARINLRTDTDIAFRLAKQNEQISQLKTQTDTASDDKVESFIAAMQAKSPNQKSSTPEQLRNQWKKEISQAKETAQINADAERSAKLTQLIKDAAKANIGAALASTLFILFWRLTLWARITE